MLAEKGGFANPHISDADLLKGKAAGRFVFQSTQTAGYLSACEIDAFPKSEHDTDGCLN